MSEQHSYNANTFLLHILLCLEFILILLRYKQPRNMAVSKINEKALFAQYVQLQIFSTFIFSERHQSFIVLVKTKLRLEIAHIKVLLPTYNLPFNVCCYRLLEKLKLPTRYNCVKTI